MLIISCSYYILYFLSQLKAVVQLRNLKTLISGFLDNKQFKIYLYLQKDALNLINIHEPLPANWEYRDLPTTTSTPSLLTRKFKKQKQNNAQAQAVRTAQQHARTNLTTDSSIKTIWMQQSQLRVLLSSERCGVSAREPRATRLVSLCGWPPVALDLQNCSFLTKRRACSWCVWAEMRRTGHANKSGKRARRGLKKIIGRHEAGLFEPLW